MKESHHYFSPGKTKEELRREMEEALNAVRARNNQIESNPSGTGEEKQ